MRACTLTYSFYESDSRVRRYAEALVKRGDEVDAIALRSNGQPPFEVICGVHVYRVQKRVVNERHPVTYLLKLLLFFVKSSWLLTRRHLKTRYDVIHVHSIPDFEVFSTVVPKLFGARVILDIHDIVPELYACKFSISRHSVIFWLLLLMERLAIAYSDHVIIANHLWRTTLVQRSVQPGKCTAIINYPDQSIFSPSPEPTRHNSDFIMCYPGTLSHHQGVDIAVSAMALLRDRAPNIKFLIVGDGPEREQLQTAIKQLRLDDSVRMVGGIPLEDVAKMLNRVDLGVVPKRSDSFGNEALSTKVFEFMAMGIPVLAADTRVERFYFDDRLVQFFVPGNAEDLASKILDLANDARKRAAFREAGIRFVQKSNWDVKKTEYLELVDRLVSQHSFHAVPGAAAHP